MTSFDRAFVRDLYDRWVEALALARIQTLTEREQTIELLTQLQSEASVALDRFPNEPGLLIITARPIEQHLCLLLSGRLQQGSVL